ncbi:MAG: DUF1330 domain-containing protein [Ilumatobacter sp.]|uniref:DUF1330 domain-containing protein n=1 Tax=Ilumatobacter sp. TaxID=1967498 RepID=UPI0032972102
MSAYLIVNYDVDDLDMYKEYQAGSVAALRIPDECEVVVFDPASEQIEGDGAGKQTVVLKFESIERAKEIYESGEYQAIVGTRHGATSKHFAVLVNSFG